MLTPKMSFEESVESISSMISFEEKIASIFPRAILSFLAYALFKVLVSMVEITSPIFSVPPRCSMSESCWPLMVMMKKAFEASFILNSLFFVFRKDISSARDSFQFFPGI